MDPSRTEPLTSFFKYKFQLSPSELALNSRITKLHFFSFKTEVGSCNFDILSLWGCLYHLRTFLVFFWSSLKRNKGSHWKVVKLDAKLLNVSPTQHKDRYIQPDTNQTHFSTSILIHSPRNTCTHFTSLPHTTYPNTNQTPSSTSTLIHSPRNYTNLTSSPATHIQTLVDQTLQYQNTHSLTQLHEHPPHQPLGPTHTSPANTKIHLCQHTQKFWSNCSTKQQLKWHFGSNP